ncbi:helix-hairpin-helix domain-containing protein [Streptomyces sp. AK08-02]|uniref:helix-hairpin-helix domain-containing protein n=1 Tax=Streptomyces sp. AK08-02 TaxID=3028654 RepID=UPI0039F5132B
MALRSRSHATTPTSGPGRGPMSDGRVRHSHRRPHGRARQRQASADEIRRRAETLFGEQALRRRESGNGPPGGERDAEAGDHGETGDCGEGTRVVTPTVRLDTPVHASGDVPVAVSAVDVPVALLRGWAGVSRDAPRVAQVPESVESAETVEAVEIPVAVGSGAGVGARAVGGRVAGAWQERAGFAVRERMPVWLQVRCGLERRSVLALTVVLVAAALLATQHFWTGRAQSVRAPEVVRAAAPVGAARADGAAVPRGVAGAAGAQIVVDVSGKVRAPGVHRLPAGSRVTDALRAAGGVRPGTKTDGLNRARFLVDGEQVVVGGAVPAPGAVLSGTGGSGGGGTGGSMGGPAAGPMAPVPLNTATVDQLDTLPGVGPVLAQHIIDYRTQHGGYRSVDELREVNGIGDRRFADLRNLVRP